MEAAEDGIGKSPARAKTALFGQFLFTISLDTLSHDREIVYYLAEEELKRAIEIYPHYPEAMNNMGLVFRHKKEYQKAEEILRDLVSRYPGYTRGWENLSLILSEQGKISSANVLE